MLSIHTNFFSSFRYYYTRRLTGTTTHNPQLLASPSQVTRGSHTVTRSLADRLTSLTNEHYCSQLLCATTSHVSHNSLAAVLQTLTASHRYSMIPAGLTRTRSPTVRVHLESDPVTTIIAMISGL